MLYISDEEMFQHLYNHLTSEGMLPTEDELDEVVTAVFGYLEQKGVIDIVD